MEHLDSNSEKGGQLFGSTTEKKGELVIFSTTIGKRWIWPTKNGRCFRTRKVVFSVDFSRLLQGTAG